MSETATFAAGCFWGVEHIFNQHFKQYGIVTRVGYTGGDPVGPTYQQVKTGTTNHAEVLRIQFDPSKVSYETLVEFFYKMHDPTTLNSQGPDIGSQYRSAIFYHSKEQKTIAERVTIEVSEKYYKEGVVTQLIEAQPFYDGEEYHQFYLEKNPEGYACPSHFLRW
ncbi:peptide methionine sulfoxide reductase MsrA [Spinellus fusiger]|nr:peptide methionine sulfoxide reductase MsrA [Spinellus fusiger]